MIMLNKCVAHKGKLFSCHRTQERWLWMVFSGWLIVYSCAGALTHYVVPPGTPGVIPDPPFLTWADAATNINDAVSESAGDGVIVLTNGQYMLTSKVTITGNRYLRSVTENPADVILDGHYEVQCMALADTGMVAGVTLAYGLAPNGGGAILEENAMMSNCVVCSNSSYTFGGGGLYLSANAAVVASLIYSNRDDSTYGAGGIYLSEGGMVSNCVVSNNYTVVGQGGGVRAASSVSSIVVNCTICANTSGGHGGGLSYRDAKGVVRATIISNNVAQQSGGGFFAERSALFRVEDCTIIGNTAQTNNGGGVYIKAGTGVKTDNCDIVSCVILGNQCVQYGGGVNTERAFVTISNCVVRLNTASSSAYGAGGIQIASTGLISHCTVDANQTVGYGGGIRLGGVGGLVEYVTVSSNTAGTGGGISVEAAATVRQCLIYGNSATNRGAVALSVANAVLESCTIAGNRGSNNTGGVYSHAASARIVNSVVYSNQVASGAYHNWTNNVVNAGMYSNCCTMPTTGLPGTGNLEADPLFISQAAGNYRLRANSTCANTGLNQPWMIGAVDLDERPRLDKFSGKVDMGAYEHIPNGTLLSGY